MFRRKRQQFNAAPIIPTYALSCFAALVYGMRNETAFAFFGALAAPRFDFRASGSISFRSRKSNDILLVHRTSLKRTNARRSTTYHQLQFRTLTLHLLAHRAGVGDLRNYFSMDEIRSTTVIDLFLAQVETRPNATALLYRPDDEFVSLSWSELHHHVLKAAAGLAQNGVEPGDRVATISENRMEWVIADLAITFARGVHTPLHVQLAPSQLKTQLEHCEAKWVFISGKSQVQAMRGQPPINSVEAWCAFDKLQREIHDKSVFAFHELGSNTQADKLQAIADSAREHVTPDSIATILYTSGTTGEPRGVVLTQGNLTSNAIGLLEYFPQRENDVRVCFLPLSHIFARTCDMITWLVRGSQFGIAKSRETVAEDCRTLRPHSISGVPYFFEKVWRKLREAGVADQPGAVAMALGDRLKYCGSGGAALPNHVFDYYQSQGVTLLQGYGLTETSPVITATAVGEPRRGSVGKAIPGVEVKIASDGEILARGLNVMQRYYRNEQATADSIRDGWFHTGDLGYVDEDGFLFITGRQKEILVTSTGKNVAPAAVEAALMIDPIVEQAMVVGDGQKFMAALIVVNLEVLNHRLGAGGALNSLANTSTHEPTRELIAKCIDQANAELAAHEQVRRFAILPAPFSIDQGELTAKLSLRRDVIVKNYGETIAKLFAN